MQEPAADVSQQLLRIHSRGKSTHRHTHCLAKPVPMSLGICSREGQVGHQTVRFDDLPQLLLVRPYLSGARGGVIVISLVEMYKWYTDEYPKLFGEEYIGYRIHRRT